jgi:hypothetical protein
MENKRASGGFVGSMTGVALAALQATHPEWFGNHPWILPSALLLLFVSLLVWLTQYQWIQKLLGLARPEQAISTEIEQALEETLARRGITPDPPALPVSVGSTGPAVPELDAKFDGELYRIVSAPKGPFALVTRQLVVGMGREFAIDIDILVEIYLVNVSPEPQYIRDFHATVEIGGRRVELIRQRDFDAWELDGSEFEYCLDSAPDEPAALVQRRAEALVPLFPEMPIELSPRRPLEGWVRFLLEEADPEELENNRTYTFTLVDSLGGEHPITRARHRNAASRIKTRKKQPRVHR